MRAAKLTSLSSSTSTSENCASDDDFATHLAVRIATIKAVAMMMDGPSFGQSGRRSFPTTFMKRVQAKTRRICQNELSAEHGGSEACLARKAISREDPLIQVFSPCDVGTRLLEKFARIRPADYTFLEPKEFSDLRSSAFAGIAEWDSFAEHVLGCTRGGEV